MHQSTPAFDEAVERVRQGGGRVTTARRVLLADLYDHGGRITAEELAAFIDSSVDIARGYGDSVIVAGFSMGGVMAAWAGLGYYARARGLIDVRDRTRLLPAEVMAHVYEGLLDEILAEDLDRVLAFHAGDRLLHVVLDVLREVEIDADEFAMYDELRKAGELRLRVYSALSVHAGVTEADADRFDALRTRYPDDPIFKTGAIKLMSDGVIEARNVVADQQHAELPSRKAGGA